MQVHLKIDFTLFQILHNLDGGTVPIHFDIGENFDVWFSYHILLLFIGHMNEIKHSIINLIRSTIGVSLLGWTTSKSKLVQVEHNISLLQSCVQAKKFYVLGLSIFNETSYIDTWCVLWDESIFVYTSHYLGQYHHNTISILVDMKVLAWYMYPNGISPQNPQILVPVPKKWKIHIIYSSDIKKRWYQSNLMST